MRIKHAHHQPANAENYYRGQHNPQHAHSFIQLPQVGIRCQNKQAMLHNLWRKDPHQHGNPHKDQRHRIEHTRGKPPSAFFILTGEVTRKHGDKSRSQRPACHEVEKQLGDAVSRIERIQRSAHAKHPRDHHLMHHTNQANHDESDHHGASGAHDLLPRALPNLS